MDQQESNNVGEDAKQSTSPFEARPSNESVAPRLSLLMLLVLLACVGAALTVPRTLGRSVDSPGVLSLLHGVVNGVGLAGILLALHQWRRRAAYPRHPGEWLWLIWGVARGGGMVGSVFVAIALGDWPDGPPDEKWLTVALVVGLANAMLVSGLYFFPALLCQERRWKVVFWLLIGFHLASVVVQGLGFFEIGVFAQGRYLYSAMWLMWFAPVTTVGRSPRRTQLVAGRVWQSGFMECEDECRGILDHPTISTR